MQDRGAPKLSDNQAVEICAQQEILYIRNEKLTTNSKVVLRCDPVF